LAVTIAAQQSGVSCILKCVILEKTSQEKFALRGMHRQSYADGDTNPPKLPMIGDTQQLGVASLVEQSTNKSPWTCLVGIQ
jgi:hypothetical protein